MDHPVGLNYPRPCGCKGIRRCLVCETEHNAATATTGDSNLNEIEDSLCSLVFCTHCSTAFMADIDQYEDKDCNWHHKLGKVPSMVFPGVTIFTEFINSEEETRLFEEIQARPWAKSQSGRLKQDYGPKCNFKKRKLKLDVFSGFPAYLQPILSKFDPHPILANYHTAEQCNLEYDPARGSAIDPHFDDFWIWGERLLTLSLGSLTFLTMSLPGKDAGPKVGEERAVLAAKRREEAEERWKDLLTRCVGDVASCNSASNCDMPSGDKPKADNDSRAEGSCTELIDAANVPSSSIESLMPPSAARVHLPMPPRSMMVLYGPARDTWVHEVRRCDIKDKRIAIAFRELAEEFLPGGKSEEVGKEVLERAARFDGVSRIEC